MWYKLDLSDYEPREVRNYLEFTEYKFSPYQLEAIQKELDTMALAEDRIEMISKHFS